MSGTAQPRSPVLLLLALSSGLLGCSHRGESGAAAVDPPGAAPAPAELRAPVVEAQPELGVLPADRRTVWNPGIPGGIPTRRQVFATLSGLAGNGTGDQAPAINGAIAKAHEAYRASGVIQEVVLPAGTFRVASTVTVNRSGVVLRGQGPSRTHLRYDGTGVALRIARHSWGTFDGPQGPWALVKDGVRGTRTLVVSRRDGVHFEPGDVLGIDEEDDPSFVRRGDAWYGKRQPKAETHGPALRGEGLYRSVTGAIRVVGKTEGADGTTLELADPLHMSFRTSQHAQVFHLATEHTPKRPRFEGVHHSGVEDLYVTGGPVLLARAAFSWLAGLEVDGNPGTPHVGSYANPGGIAGRSVDLLQCYRCELRGSYIHHSRNIVQGGGAYLVSLGAYTSESLVEDNIIVFGNKLVVGNMMGGGNVIAYNYVDNARTDHPTWQEGAIDLNHLAFTHHALVEGNWATNLTSDTTHGNAGWHVFFRNFATGQNSAPLYGRHPYVGGAPDRQYRRAAGPDGFHRETTYVGNVLQVERGAVYQVDPGTGPQTDVPAVWRVGWGVDGGGGNRDDGTALRLLYRHGNWDSVTGAVRWDEGSPVRRLPPSLYLPAKPAFFGTKAWPWVEPTGTSAAERVKVLPAKARYDALGT